MSDLAMTYYKQGKYNQAEAILNQCGSKISEVFGESHPSTLVTMSDLALIIQQSNFKC